MRSRSLHPYVLMLFALVAMIYLFQTNLLVVQAYFYVVVVILSVRHAKANRAAYGIIRTSILFILLYTSVGALFGQPSSHIVWRGPSIPGLGTLLITQESVSQSLIRATRTWNLLFLMLTLGRMMRPERVLALLGRRFSRVGLTISMVVTFIPTLLSERERILEILKVRGISLKGRPAARVRSQVAVYQTLLMNALERSFQVAESMTVRGYGTHKRSTYNVSRWHAMDSFYAGVSAALLGLDLYVGRWGSFSINYLIAALISLLLVVIGGRRDVQH